MHHAGGPVVSRLFGLLVDRTRRHRHVRFCERWCMVESPGEGEEQAQEKHRPNASHRADAVPSEMSDQSHHAARDASIDAVFRQEGGRALSLINIMLCDVSFGPFNRYGAPVSPHARRSTADDALRTLAAHNWVIDLTDRPRRIRLLHRRAMA